MTGFVAVVGPHRGEDLLFEAREPVAGGSRLAIVHQEPGATLLATEDLPTLKMDGYAAVGDISLADPDAMHRTLWEQRTLGLEALAKGYSTAEQIAGGFAEDYHFMLWDVHKKILLAGRDGLGVRPLFYAEAGERFIVASAMRLILMAGGFEALDSQSVARYVAGRFPLAERTYFQGSSRLAAGARLTKRAGEKVQLSACEAPIGLPTPWPGHDPVGAFREAFTRAVGYRLALPDETCALLSGGLDSSSIAVVAAELCRERELSPPETLSLVFDATPQWSERAYIADVRDAAGLRGLFVEGRVDRPLERIASYLEAHGGPFLAPGLSTGGRLYDLSAKQGCSVLLDGHGGDEVVSYGWGRLHSSAAAGRWKALWSMLRGIAPKGRERGSLFILYWMKYGPARRSISRAIRLKRAIARRVSRIKETPKPLRFVAAAWRSNLGEDPAPPELPDPGLSIEASHHYATVTSPQQAQALETLHAAASAVGITPRYPFWDRHLLALCLSLPEAAKLSDRGLARWVLRQAVNLPPSVRDREDKLDFSPHLALGLVEGEGAWLEELIEKRKDAPVWRFACRLQASHALRTLKRRREAAPGDIVQTLWRLSVLSIWLDGRATRGLDDGIGAPQVSSS